MIKILCATDSVLFGPDDEEKSCGRWGSESLKQLFLLVAKDAE